MSRDPNRIPVVLEKIRKIWEEHSGLRFGQMMMNFYSYLNQKKVNMHGIEDDEFIIEFEKFYDSLKGYTPHGDEFEWRHMIDKCFDW